MTGFPADPCILLPLCPADPDARVSVAPLPGSTLRHSSTTDDNGHGSQVRGPSFHVPLQRIPPQTTNRSTPWPLIFRPPVHPPISASRAASSRTASASTAGCPSRSTTSSAKPSDIMCSAASRGIPRLSR